VPLFGAFYPPVAYSLLASSRFWYFLAASAFVAAGGLICWWLSLIPVWAALTFSLPFIQLPFAALALRIFGKLMNRPPCDVVWNRSKGLLWDRILFSYMGSLGVISVLSIGRP
jgi:hypothetical protein